MKRLGLMSALAVAVLLAVGAPVVAAAPDDDIPGVLLPIGSSLLETVDSGDPSDVYAVDLTAGQEVHFRCDPGSTAGRQGSLHLLVPGVASVADSADYREISYSLRSGSPTRGLADFDYIPAKSGRCFLWIEWQAGSLVYSLSATRTSRAALTLGPDTNDIPGLSAPPGTLTEVVSALADPDDVFAVALTAGKPLIARLMPLTPYSNSAVARASLYLLDPDTPSLADRFGHVLGGQLLAAVNSRDPASRATADIEYMPTESGTYYLWVQDGGAIYGRDFGDFAYRLSIFTGTTPEPPTFTDIQGSPYINAIYEVASRSIIRGFPDGTFRPSAPVSRQQFAKMVVKTLGLPVTGTEVCPFGDVATGIDSDDPLYPDKYVAVCARNGIALGRTPTTFDPYGNITRQQLITMVTRAANLQDPPAEYTPDFSPDQFYPNDHYLNARKAAFARLLDGLVGVGSAFDFLAPSTRGECAQLLYNLLNGG